MGGFELFFYGFAPRLPTDAKITILMCIINRERMFEIIFIYLFLILASLVTANGYYYLGGYVGNTGT